MENNKKHPIKSFQDLEVYQNLYKAMLIIHKDIIPKLPHEEKYDLGDQMRRASKGAPAFIAEGFAKRYQKRQWQKYINDTIGECNEMIHHLSICRDLYINLFDQNLIEQAIDLYDHSARQLTNLGKSWTNYHNKLVY